MKDRLPLVNALVIASLTFNAACQARNLTTPTAEGQGGKPADNTPPPSPSGHTEAKSHTVKVSPVCVDTHPYHLGETDLIKQLDLLKLAGVSTTRFDLEWGEVNPADGVWDFSHIDHIIELANDRGINILPILNLDAAPGYTGRAYSDFIKSPEDYAAYVGKVAENLKGKVTSFEMGNEPDRAGMDPKTYTLYLNAGYDAIKAVDPNIQVVSGGVTSHDPVGWLKGMQEAGAKFDAFGYHFYPPGKPDGPEVEVMTKLTQMLGGKSIVVTEFGWATDPNGVSPEHQADGISMVYQAIQAHSSPFANVSLACVYELVSGLDPNNPEDNYGIVDVEGNPKPAFDAVQNASKLFP